MLDTALDVRLSCLDIDELGDWICTIESTTNRTQSAARVYAKSGSVGGGLRNRSSMR